jgi:hypothetical protein
MEEVGGDTPPRIRLLSRIGQAPFYGAQRLGQVLD